MEKIHKNAKRTRKDQLLLHWLPIKLHKYTTTNEYVVRSKTTFPGDNGDWVAVMCAITIIIISTTLHIGRSECIVQLINYIQSPSVCPSVRHRNHLSRQRKRATTLNGNTIKKLKSLYVCLLPAPTLIEWCVHCVVSGEWWSRPVDNNP